MSSFSDTFTRDENKDTQYDDSAFHTFAGTVLLVTILPLVYIIIRRVFTSNELLNKKFKNCECKNCKERINKHYARLRKKNFNFTFYFMMFMVIILSYLFYLSYYEIVKHGSNFKRFDPYEILEIEPGTEEKDIKKAYRRLTLKFHPDKNPNNLQAKAKFIMIAKAYEALTDEIARKNFELYGNPDGPGSMRLAVGLPSFVLNKKNHMPILILFLIFIVIIIPGFVWFWFSSSNKYDDSGMMVENQKIFFEFLNENTLLRHMPFILGISIEFNKLKFKTNGDDLYKLWKYHVDKMPKHKEEFIPIENKKTIALLYAYVNNQSFSEDMKEDVALILKSAPVLLLNMYNMTVYFTNVHMMTRMYKNFGYNCIRTVLEFSQLIHQKVSKESSPFLQLPYFTEQNIKNFKFSNKADEDNKLSTLPNFLTKKTKEQRKAVLSTVFSNEAEIEEIENCCQILPVYNLKIETFVEGFGDEVLVDDLLTIKVTVERSNLDETKELGVGHSNFFPDIFKEKVVVLLKLNDNRIVYEIVLDIENNVTTHEFKHMVREVGAFEFKAELISLNYKGFDLNEKFTITTSQSSQKRKELIDSIERREVKKLEPSYFQQMLNQVIPVQDDEEEEEEEETKQENKCEETEKKEVETTEKESSDKKPEANLLEEPAFEDGSSKTRRSKRK